MLADLAVGSPRTRLSVDTPAVTPDLGQDLAPRRGQEAAGLAPDATHLAPEALPRWRALLEFHWRARLERVTELSLAYHDAEDAGQQGDATRLLRLAVTERRALAEIEAALSRLGAGAYGTCERCAVAVSPARLTRIPQARYCAACDR